MSRYSDFLEIFPQYRYTGNSAITISRFNDIVLMLPALGISLNRGSTVLKTSYSNYIVGFRNEEKYSCFNTNYQSFLTYSDYNMYIITIVLLSVNTLCIDTL